MSTVFQGGFADGKSLLLKRSPLFLRVVKDKKGDIDALDLLEDKPEPDETIMVYRLVKRGGAAFVDGVDKKGKRWGGRFEIASYTVNQSQPSPEVVRDTAKWRAWTQAEAEADNED